MSVTIILHLQINEQLTLVILCIAEIQTVLVLLGTIFIDKVIRLIHLTERKNDLTHSQPVPILILYDGRSTAEKETSDNRQDKLRKPGTNPKHHCARPQK